MVQRIEDHVRDPRLKDRLVSDVERGDGLSNSDAAKVYDIETEPGIGGFLRKFNLSPHIQYRMDLRSVTVEDVLDALRDFNKRLAIWKAQGNPVFGGLMEKLVRSKDIKWAARSGLQVVFKVTGGGIVHLITTFWKGVSDPPAPAECP